MVYSIVLVGMIFALTMSFAISIVILMYMLLKKKQKNVPTLVLTGGMAMIAGPFLMRLILESITSKVLDFEKLGNDNYIVYALIAVFFITITVVLAITVFLYILEPGGLTVNRVIVFATGFQMFYSLLFTALNMYNNFTIATYINSGEMEKIMSDTEESKDSLNKTIEYYTNLKAIDFFAEGICQILLFVIITAVSLYIYKGLYKKTIAKNIAIATGFVYIKEFGYQLLTHYINSVVGVIYYALFAAIAVYFTHDIILDNVKIKPKSMREENLL